MYNYEEPSMFSGKKGAILIVVLLLHVLVGYGFYSGLARRIAQIDKPKADDKPPPPPPKLEEVKPFVPPPEFVDIQAPQEVNNNAITQTSQVATPAPVAAPAPVQHTFTPVKMDPNHPLHIGEDYYPDASKRAGEEGTCKVKVTVGPDGRITEASIEASSGFPRLDDACLKGVKGQRMKPALQDGKPIEYQGVLPITWKLKN